jgi:CBS domain-containing protein
METFMRVDALSSAISKRLAQIAPDALLRTAACALSVPHIGLVVVCDETKKAIGVVSKSDIVRHLTNVGVAETEVATVMSRNILSCFPEDDLYGTWQKMVSEGRQNIPVLDAASVPVGVLDIRDAVKMLLEQEEYQEHLLLNYVTGVGYQ